MSNPLDILNSLEPQDNGGGQITREDLENMAKMLPSMYDKDLYYCLWCGRFIGKQGQIKYWFQGVWACSEKCHQQVKESYEKMMEEVERQKDDNHSQIEDVMVNDNVKNNRIYLSIDGSNYFHSQRHLGWDCDPAKLKSYVADHFGNLVSASYYLSLMPDGSEGRERYRTALRHMGYCVVPIYLKQFYTSEGVREKADADIKLALDAYIAHPHYDTLVLVSGDGDFAYLVEALRILQKRVKVISTASLVARELMEAVGDDFYELNDLREYVEKENGE